MIIEIEYYKGDVYLRGAKISRTGLAAEFSEVERIYDKIEDNFAELFCRMYGYEKIPAGEFPNYVYDRDTKKLYTPKGTK